MRCNWIIGSFKSCKLVPLEFELLLLQVGFAVIIFPVLIDVFLLIIGILLVKKSSVRGQWRCQILLRTSLVNQLHPALMGHVILYAWGWRLPGHIYIIINLHFLVIKSLVVCETIGVVKLEKPTLSETAGCFTVVYYSHLFFKFSSSSSKFRIFLFFRGPLNAFTSYLRIGLSLYAKSNWLWGVIPFLDFGWAFLDLKPNYFGIISLKGLLRYSFFLA